VARLQSLLAQRGPATPALEEPMLAQLRALLVLPAPHAAAEPLRVLQVGVGTQIRMVPLEQVLAFDAADKYLRVLTAQGEHLIRTPLKELLPRLDPQCYWQVHRGTVVRADAIEAVHRDEAGRLRLALHGLAERFAVSRLYAGRFRAM
jgi:DNA-binding LytR/AlgR family response regulator